MPVNGVETAMRLLRDAASIIDRERRPGGRSVLFSLAANRLPRAAKIRRRQSEPCTKAIDFCPHDDEALRRATSFRASWRCAPWRAFRDARQDSRKRARRIPECRKPLRSADGDSPDRRPTMAPMIGRMRLIAKRDAIPVTLDRFPGKRGERFAKAECGRSRPPPF